MRSSRSARRGAPNKFRSLPRPARPESIEGCDRAAEPSARARGRAQRAGCAGTSTRPRSAKCCSEQAKASKGLNSPASGRGAAMLRHSSDASLKITDCTLKAETRKCWARMETLFLARQLKLGFASRALEMAGPVLEQPPETSFQRSGSRRAAKTQAGPQWSKPATNTPALLLPTCRGLHCSYRVL